MKLPQVIFQQIRKSFKKVILRLGRGFSFFIWREIMNRYLNDNKGSMLPLAIIFMMVFILMGFGLINLGAIDAIEVTKADVSTQAFWLAEAGLARAMHTIKAHFDSGATGLTSPNLVVDGNTILPDIIISMFYPMVIQLWQKEVTKLS